MRKPIILRIADSLNWVVTLRILKGKDAWTFLVELESRELDLVVFKESVRPIIDQVKLREDDAVSELTERLYGVKLAPEEFQVSIDVIEEALSLVDRDLPVIEELVSKVKEFYSRQKIESFIAKEKGSEYGVTWIPLERVGIHVPEGEGFAYFSTLIYTAVPAKVAGVPQVFVFTPPLANGAVNPYLLAAAKLSGVDRVYRIGGPIAVAAMAYGTTTIPEVQKIFGTGDLLFMTAKKIVSPDVAVDFPSTPVETVVLAGAGANPLTVAWELVSQAEHGLDTFLMVITTDESLADAIVSATRSLSEEVSMPVIEESLGSCSILVLESWREVEEAIDVISPARVVIVGEINEELRFANVGATIWNTPSPLVDYALGVPQRLPSSRYSRFRGPLTLYDFMKSFLTVKLSREFAEEIADLSIEIARVEGMELHARYIEKMLEGSFG